MFTCSHAITHKKTQIIQICSQCQSIDMLTNTIIFTDQVTLKYKNINLHADKILISHAKDIHHLSVIEAHGKPAILNQTQEDIKNSIFAQSLIIYYNTNDDTVTFIGNAYIEQSGSSIKSDKIIYSIKKKQMKAISNKGNKVITTLLANQSKKYV
ncbi:lipopolysaccharide transport periplasmic protein LptA [Blochmannia endosymbiont of Camponotus sp.]|uniref:lipopolysaccharide transport periplasmic protein LptA n=1 Tax=Blochmannia endosymbiont of Camponotus sp. TaxID=700220 RepID=UPI002024D2F2|nr:lipopolysaccharide transport periplasmic protein LptA [Blochmannia endosymbiont of Camponotus sp.]URJ29749.1 lipopolysaccharide transport periplasmic protein LptA [Blochmannia endosymbiont of Camponotus sp.]